MSIMRAGNFFELICDVCGEECGEQFYNFQEAVDHKKANNWQAKKYGTDWVDSCPDCQD